jgi:DNA-binding MarR family transcriptional regulator
VNYDLSSYSDDVRGEVIGWSGSEQGESLSIQFIVDTDKVHILFQRGPFLVLLPGSMTEGSASLLCLGGRIEGIWMEPADIEEDILVEIDDVSEMESLESQEVSLKASGFKGTRSILVRAHGFHEGARITSNPMFVTLTGEEKGEEGFPRTTIMYAGGGASAAGAVIIGSFAYFYTASEVFRYKWLLLAFIPLYSTVHGEKVLDHFFRGRLYEYIVNNPGATFTGLKEHFEVNNGTLTYHLHRLEREELITHRNLGKYKMFYADGVRVRGVEVVISQIDREIITSLSENPGMTSSQLSSMIRSERSKRTISRHIKQLERKGFIVSERHDGKRVLFLTGELERVLMPKKGVVEVSEMTRLDI